MPGMFISFNGVFKRGEALSLGELKEESKRRCDLPQVQRAPTRWSRESRNASANPNGSKDQYISSLVEALVLRPQKFVIYDVFSFLVIDPEKPLPMKKVNLDVTTGVREILSLVSWEGKIMGRTRDTVLEAKYPSPASSENIKWEIFHTARENIEGMLVLPDCLLLLLPFQLRKVFKDNKIQDSRSPQEPMHCFCLLNPEVVVTVDADQRICFWSVKEMTMLKFVYPESRDLISQLRPIWSGNEREGRNLVVTNEDTLIGVKYLQGEVSRCGFSGGLVALETLKDGRVICLQQSGALTVYEMIGDKLVETTWIHLSLSKDDTLGQMLVLDFDTVVVVDGDKVIYVDIERERVWINFIHREMRNGKLLLLPQASVFESKEERKKETQDLMDNFSELLTPSVPKEIARVVFEFI